MRCKSAALVRYGAGVLGTVCLMVAATPVRAQSACPAAKALPQLTIDNIRDPAVPVIDKWQVFWGDLPLSDFQVATLAKNDPFIERTRVEMQERGGQVYVWMGAAALGTALSSVGWVLYGRQLGASASDDAVSAKVSLPLAAGGLLIGAMGTLLATSAIQRPLDPHLAPTPEHRLTRAEMRRLVTAINKDLYQSVCDAVTLDTAEAP